jgi:hypothetical protein
MQKIHAHRLCCISIEIFIFGVRCVVLDFCVLTFHFFPYLLYSHVLFVYLFVYNSLSFFFRPMLYCHSFLMVNCVCFLL